MKVSLKWLQKYFSEPLPSVAALAKELTFHAFEIESIEGDVMDVKVLPDRAGYALCHRGIASEVAAILKTPMKYDPLRQALPSWPATDQLAIDVDERYVNRHMGALVKGVKVGPSPAWLKEALEAVGQRSINNIVDITNYTMLDVGQPLHAFDVAKIQGDSLHITIRKAKPGEKITVLTGEEYTLTDSMYVIADATTGAPLDIAGLKGGAASGITESTTDLFISVGNYDAVLIRKMSQGLKLFTDAGQRYQNRPSTELNAYGMRDVLKLIADVADGTVEGVVDAWPRKPEVRTVSVTAAQVGKLLGATYSDEVVADVFTRLNLPFKKEDETFVVTPPFERNDLVIKEDLIEEVGRIVGYDYIVPTQLPSSAPVQFTKHRKLIEAVRERVVAEGYNEVSTYVFQDSGDVEMALPLADDKRFLRTNLAFGHKKAIAQNLPNLPLFGAEDLRIFEIGHVWPKGEEKFVLGITYAIPATGADKKIANELSRMRAVLEGVVKKSLSTTLHDNTIEVDMHDLTDTDAVPDFHMTIDKGLSAYHQFSLYPFVLRDLAVWVPASITSDLIYQVIRERGGSLLLRTDLFDTFFKDGKTSYAFRLVFQSMERTLSDAEVGDIMAKVTTALNAEPSWQVR